MSVRGVVCGSLAAASVSAILVATKPSVMFDANGTPLPLGVDPSKQTLLPAWLCVVAAGVAVYALYLA